MVAEKIKLKVLIIRKASGILMLGSNELYWDISMPVKKSDTALMSEEYVTPIDASWVRLDLSMMLIIVTYPIVPSEGERWKPLASAYRLVGKL